MRGTVIATTTLTSASAIISSSSVTPVRTERLGRADIMRSLYVHSS
jgi:hypothetical protein